MKTTIGTLCIIGTLIGTSAFAYCDNRGACVERTQYQQPVYQPVQYAPVQAPQPRDTMGEFYMGMNMFNQGLHTYSHGGR